MYTLILVLTAFAAGYAVRHWGWQAIRTWVMVAAAALAGWWEDVSGFVTGLVG